MISSFWSDLQNAKKAEQLVFDLISSFASADFTIKDVSDDRAYYHKGDIVVIDKDGKETCIEVKQDYCIANTKNVLCEEKVYYFDTSSYAKGNFYSDYEVYAVVTPQCHKVVFMDFSVLKRIYKNGGRYKEIVHDEQITYCYLLPLDYIEEQGGIIAIVDYENMVVTYKR